MRAIVIFGLCILLWSLHPAGDAAAQEEAAPRGMSAVAILEGLTSPDPAVCDRATLEVDLMDAATAEDLGQEVLRTGVRQAQCVLRAVRKADNDNAVYPAAFALESEFEDVRNAALEALIDLTPGHVAAAGTAPFRQDRLNTLRELIDSSSFVKELCESIKRDERGRMIQPVERSMRLMILLDRLFGTEAMGMLLNRFADVMLGTEVSDNPESSQAERKAEQDERSAAAVWCEAIWIQDPAIAFNYSPVGMYQDRREAVTRLRKALSNLKETPVHALRKDWGDATRYGDYLAHVYLGGGADYIQENQYAAVIRTKWWRGEEVGLDGDAYNEAVKDLKVSGRQYRRIRAELREWWFEYRAETSTE